MTQDRAFLAALILTCALSFFLASCAGAVVADRLFGEPEPTPLESPRMWVHPQSGGACYYLGDTLGPCFSWPKETP